MAWYYTCKYILTSSHHQGMKSDQGGTNTSYNHQKTWIPPHKATYHKWNHVHEMNHNKIFPCEHHGRGTWDFFVKCQHGTALWIYLTKMGHQKPPTPLITDSETLYGFVNGNICQHRSRAIAMRLHCSRNRVRQGHYLVYWSRGKKTSQLLHQTPCNQKST